jgi:hypothetical protein
MTEEQLTSLLEHLQSNPGIKKVYFNEKGQWLFHSRAEYPIEKSRAEVIKALSKPKGEFPAQKETDLAGQLKFDAGVSTETVTDSEQKIEGKSPVVPIGDKVKDPLLLDANDDLTHTEVGNPAGNQVVTDVPEIPAHVNPAEVAKGTVKTPVVKPAGGKP